MTPKSSGSAAVPVTPRFEPRILIQCGSYELDNLGDLSMLRAAIERIRARLPHARFSVLSRNEAALKALAPFAHRIGVENKSEWKWMRTAYIAARAAVPRLDSMMRRRFPETFARLLQMKGRRLVNRDALRDTDFIVLSGGGYINDVFPGQAWSSLERLRVADAMGIPFAIVGHAFGPLRDATLRGAAATLLPRARLISVRERLASVPILHSLGVSPETIFVTGDDAVEHALEPAAQEPRRGVGINLRAAPYSGITEQEISQLRDILGAATANLDCQLIPLPICIVTSAESESDADVAIRIIGGLENARTDFAVPTTIDALTARVALCRLVVTGSYHCAVFALSQGIPTVCIHASEYYAFKFRGLADQFPSGCVVIDRFQAAYSAALDHAIREAWHNAHEFRAGLLREARNQVEAGNAAYDALCAIIERECGAVERG